MSNVVALESKLNNSKLTRPEINPLGFTVNPCGMF